MPIYVDGKRIERDYEIRKYELSVMMGQNIDRLPVICNFNGVEITPKDRNVTFLTSFSPDYQVPYKNVNRDRLCKMAKIIYRPF